MIDHRLQRDDMVLGGCDGADRGGAGGEVDRSGRMVSSGWRGSRWRAVMARVSMVEWGSSVARARAMAAIWVCSPLPLALGFSLGSDVLVGFGVVLLLIALWLPNRPSRQVEWRRLAVAGRMSPALVWVSLILTHLLLLLSLVFKASMVL